MTKLAFKKCSRNPLKLFQIKLSLIEQSARWPLWLPWGHFETMISLFLVSSLVIDGTYVKDWVVGRFGLKVVKGRTIPVG